AIVLVAQRGEYADVLDLAGEAQIVVQRIRDDVGRHSALAEVRCRGRRRRETADLPKGLVRRCQHLTGERPALNAEIEAAVLEIALVGHYRQSTGAFDSSPGALSAPRHRALHIEQGRISLVGRARGPLPAGLHQDGHSLVLSAVEGGMPSTPCARTGAQPGGRNLSEAADGFGDVMSSLGLI